MGVVAGRAVVAVVKERGGVSKPSGGSSRPAPSKPTYENKAVVYMESTIHRDDEVRINFTTGAVRISCVTMVSKEKPMRVFKSLIANKTWAFPQVGLGDGITAEFTDAAAFKITGIENASSATVTIQGFENSNAGIRIQQQPSKSNGFTVIFKATCSSWRGGWYKVNLLLTVK